MITWMQRHKKWLIITIWISTIAFVGAGFVGWGQYSYGDKAGAIAKVGEHEITMGELQKSYSNLYAQYNKVFQGDFDEEKAKSFGLKKQALEQLVDQALVLNLAKSYNLSISNQELINELKTQTFFFKNGLFDKETYKQVLSANRMSLKEYESALKKDLLIKKVLTLLPVNVNKNEANILNIVNNIADKIEYKILDQNAIKVSFNEDDLKSYWKDRKNNYLTEVSYDIEYIKQPKENREYDKKTIQEYYLENKTHFKNNDGKIKSLQDAKKDVISELNQKATKEQALRKYIAYKKGKIKDATIIKKVTISVSKNILDTKSLEKVSKLSKISPFMKPVIVKGEYFIVKLINKNLAKAKSFNAVKDIIKDEYIANKKSQKLLELAKSSVNSFKGDITQFITSKDALMLKKLTLIEANQFLKQLFMTNHKRGFISIDNNKVVLYNILEQKLLNIKNEKPDSSIGQLKESMFNQALINKLKNQYKIEIFIEGL